MGYRSLSVGCQALNVNTAVAVTLILALALLALTVTCYRCAVSGRLRSACYVDT